MGSNQWVDNGLEPLQRLAVVQHVTAEAFAVDEALRRHVRKRRRHGLDRRAADTIEFMHSRVGVIDRRPFGFEHPRRGGLPHADRSR